MLSPAVATLFPSFVELQSKLLILPILFGGLFMRGEGGSIIIIIASRQLREFGGGLNAKSAGNLSEHKKLRVLFLFFL